MEKNETPKLGVSTILYSEGGAGRDVPCNVPTNVIPYLLSNIIGRLFPLVIKITLALGDVEIALIISY